MNKQKGYLTPNLTILAFDKNDLIRTSGEVVTQEVGKDYSQLNWDSALQGGMN